MQHSNQVHRSITFLGTKPSVTGDALEKSSAPTSSHQQPPGEAIFTPKATREEEGLWGGQVEIRCHSGIARRKKIKKGVGRRSLLNSCSLLSSVQLLSS